jgi:hypothetical protein
MSRFLLPILLVLTVASCELFELPLSVQPADEALVISSVSIGNGTMIVTASRSFSPLSGRSVTALEDDIIESLFVNRGLVILSSSAGIDTLSSLPIPGFFGGFASLGPDGGLVHIQVRDSSTGLTAEATTTRMAAIGIDRSEYRDIRIGSFDVRRLRVWIEDPDGDNYYALHVYNLPLGSGNELDSLYFRDEELLLHSEVFTDRSATEGSLRRVVDLNRGAAGDTVVAVLSNIDEGYYRFLDARRRTGGVVASLANEPINAPTNVIGGYGYFSAHQLRAKVVVIE